MEKESLSIVPEGQNLVDRVNRLERQLAEAQATILTLTSPQGDRAQAGNVQEYERLLQELEQEKVRSQALAAAAEQRAEELEAIFEAAPDPIVVYDRNGRPIRANLRAIQAYGFDPTKDGFYEAVKKLMVRHSDGRPVEFDELPSHRSLKGERVAGENYLFTNLQGKEFFILAQASPISVHGEIAGAVAVWHDITDQKQAEHALRESENNHRELAEALEVERAKLAAAIDHLPVGVGIEDAAGNTLSLNNAGLRLHGFRSEADMISRLEHYLDEFELRYLDGRVMPFEEWPASRALRGEFVRDYELRLRNKLNGTDCVLSYSVAPVKNNQGEMVLVLYVIQDMTGRKQVEMALRESEERFRDLADSMPQLVWTARPDGTVDYYNQRFREFDGITPVTDEEWHWSPVLHPEDMQPTVDAWSRAVETGETYQIEHRVRMAGGSFRWHLSRGVPVRDAAGRITRWFGTATDIHELKLAQETLKDYATRLERSNRDLQEFAYVASHDLQEPLRKIEAFGAALVETSTNLNEKQNDYIARMRTAAGRMRTMVEDLLALSRIERKPQPFTPIDLGQIAQEVLFTLEVQVQRTGGQIVLDDLPEIEADPFQMRQLLQNLIGNALKFNRRDVPPLVRVYTGQRTASTIEIVVEDNGIGFQESEAERIFQPFQRLVRRSDFEGNGMGLAICRRIVERHNGAIRTRSRPGQGSTFVITLPVHQRNTL